MLFSLTVYWMLFQKKTLAGAGWMAIAIVLTIAAAVLQAAGPYQVSIIWPFDHSLDPSLDLALDLPLDHNGVFHIVQIVALYFFYIGLKLGLKGGLKNGLNSSGRARSQVE